MQRSPTASPSAHTKDESEVLLLPSANTCKWSVIIGKEETQEALEMK